MVVAGIPLIGYPVVVGITLMELAHDSVPIDLCDDAGGGDAQALSISLLYLVLAYHCWDYYRVAFINQ